MILIEFDKAGAEWVVVAYLSGDETMIDVIESGKRPHAVTGALLMGVPEELVLKEDKIVGKLSDPDKIMALRQQHIPEWDDTQFAISPPRSMSIYQMGKKSNHGLNYREGIGQFALINEITEREAKPIVEAYPTTVYPGVGRWWETIDEQLKGDRVFTNCFGRKARLMGEMGKGLKNQATAFVPQSTISDMVVIAMTKAYDDMSPAFARMDLLTQTYDSVTLQYPTDNLRLMADFMRKMGMGYMSPEVEYYGRKFTVRSDVKIGYDWGHMVELKLVDNAREMVQNIKSALNTLDQMRAA